MNTLDCPVLAVMLPAAASASDATQRVEPLVPTGMSATIFDPKTQSWYHIGSSHIQSHLNQRIAKSLGWRLVAACAVPACNQPTS